MLIICFHFNSLRAKIFNRNMNMHLQFLPSLHTETFPVKDKDIPNLHIQYHGCWWSGDARSQGISNHDIDLDKPS